MWQCPPCVFRDSFSIIYSWWILFKSLQFSLGRSLLHSILLWKLEPLWLPLYSQLHLLNLGICQPFNDFLSKYYIPQTLSSQPVGTVIEMRCLYSKLNFILISAQSLRISPYVLQTTLLNIYIYILFFKLGRVRGIFQVVPANLSWPKAEFFIYFKSLLYS